MQMNQLSMQQAALLVNNRFDYHNACVKNGYHKPNVKTALCTLEFMKEVRTGVNWVPKLTDIKLAPCPNPPSTDDIRPELVLFIEANIT